MKYPHITVQLTGKDGNAFAILGYVQTGLKEGGVPDTEIQEFLDEATSKDYDHLLRTCMDTVDVL